MHVASQAWEPSSMLRSPEGQQDELLMTCMWMATYPDFDLIQLSLTSLNQSKLFNIY